MSRTCFGLILKNILKSNNPMFLLTTSVTMISSNFFYAILTREEKEIIVKKKYKFDRSGFTEFMIIDSNDKHYNLNNSLWYWKWDSIEDWYLIKEEQKLNFPLLSDFNKAAATAFDVLYETFPAFEMQGVSKRAAFVLDANGVVQYAEICPTPGDLPNFEAIQTTLNSLN